MKILHTADWHLGKKLEQFDRSEEHQYFLDWLIEKIKSECIDVLIIAGDIFDTGTPGNQALEQYYSFLRQIKNTCCREVIVIGGNHDSISTLNAPKQLLKFFNVHVIGGVPEEFTDQIITIKNDNGEVELVVCAVPFLRDKDIRLSVAGETAEEREQRIKQGISNHYHQFLPHITNYKQQGIPVITTGHLFAAGVSTSDSEKEIHVGNLGNVSADHFPTEFDYVALGHIHRPQIVGKNPLIRYSGSPIPLSFSENEDQKQVVLIEFFEGKLKEISEIKIPACRKLLRIKGNLDTVKAKLFSITDYGFLFPTWVEVQVSTDSFIPDLDEQLNEIVSFKPFIQKVFTRQIKTKLPTTLEYFTDEAMELNSLDPRSVFIKKCEAEFGDQDFGIVLNTFDEALEQMMQYNKLEN